MPQLTRRLYMSTISIIGSGTMATAVAGRIANAGHTVEVVNRDAAKAQALAGKLAAGATTGTYGAAPAGDIVIFAVPYGSVAAVVADFGDALDGKVIIDLANPVNADMTGLVIPKVIATDLRGPSLACRWM
jgi:8-hydroxy-5-deazaflavin:NADPH oxidoreductase